MQGVVSRKRSAQSNSDIQVSSKRPRDNSTAQFERVTRSRSAGARDVALRQAVLTAPMPSAAPCQELSRAEQVDLILADLRLQGVDIIHFEFSNARGECYSISYNIDVARGPLLDGFAFDGSSIEGFTTTERSDLKAYVEDLKTLVKLPYVKPYKDKFGRVIEPAEPNQARVICDVYTTSLNGANARFEKAPRTVAKNIEARLAARGMRGIAAVEVEFFLIEKVSPESARLKKDTTSTHYTKHYGQDPSNACKSEILQVLNKMGLRPEKYHGEVAVVEGEDFAAVYQGEAGAGGHHPFRATQHEITVRAAPLVEAADNLLTMFNVIKDIADKHGFEAEFMAKPFLGVNGSGGHLNHSLQDIATGRNLMADPSAPAKMSRLGLQFAKGEETHLIEIMALTNCALNSFMRLRRGFETPINVATGPGNRSAAIRIPEVDEGETKANRLEARFPDLLPGSPYLKMAALFAAGLDGLEHNMEPAELRYQNLWELSDAELDQLGIRKLPASLEEAVAVFESSAWVREVFGDDFVDGYVSLLRKKAHEHAAPVAAPAVEKSLWERLYHSASEMFMFMSLE